MTQFLNYRNTCKDDGTCYPCKQCFACCNTADQICSIERNYNRGCYIAHFRGFIKSTFYQGFFGQGQCQKSESIAAAIWLELKWWSHHQQYSWELSQFQSISMSSPSPSQRSQLNQPTILHWQHWLQCSCIIIIASQFDPYIPGRALAFFYLNHVPDSP